VASSPRQHYCCGPGGRGFESPGPPHVKALLRQCFAVWALVPHKPLLLLWLFGQFAATGSARARYAEAASPVSLIRRCTVQPSAGCAGAVAGRQLTEGPSSRSGYDCLVKESRGEAGGSLRLAAALIPSSLDALVCGQFDVARSHAGSRVTAGPFAGHSGDARPLAVFV